jgi:starvation-inducible DNA-binding protein
MNATLWKTQNDLPEENRVAAIALLNEHLADAIDLALQAKQAHWNMKESADDLAERAVQLGGFARGTLQTVARNTRLPAYAMDLTWGCDHLQALSASVAAFGKSARAAIASADRASDADTADLFTQISRSTDKLLWKLEAHLFDV